MKKDKKTKPKLTTCERCNKIHVIAGPTQQLMRNGIAQQCGYRYQPEPKTIPNLYYYCERITLSQEGVWSYREATWAIEETLKTFQSHPAPKPPKEDCPTCKGLGFHLPARDYNNCKTCQGTGIQP